MALNTQHSPQLLLKAQKVLVAFLDVDGVLTDGGQYLSPRGETLKRFSTLDRHGFKLLQAAGIVAAIITGSDSKSLRTQLQALGIVHAQYGVDDKCVAAQMTLHALDLQWDQAAVMGHDWPDLPMMRRCVFSAAPPNAHDEVIGAADYVLQRSGGNGAAREFCDLLLVASGKYARLLKEAAA